MRTEPAIPKCAGERILDAERLDDRARRAEKAIEARRVGGEGRGSASRVGLVLEGASRSGGEIVRRVAGLVIPFDLLRLSCRPRVVVAGLARLCAQLDLAAHELVRRLGC